MSVSHIVHHYCITGSADGDMRVWNVYSRSRNVQDLRDMTRSVVRVHHPTSVRSVAFSPSNWQPLHAAVGLDNGSIYRWDLKMGQRGLQDRLLVAHTAPVTSLDWCNRNSQTPASPTTASMGDSTGNGMGWLVSGGLDRCVKVWDLTAPGDNKPMYTLHPSFPVRRVVWRPSHQCELAVVSNAEFSSGSNADLGQNHSVGTGGTGESEKHGVDNKSSVGGDAVEIWDVRRGWIPKWSVTGSAIECGVTDITFSTPDAIWTQSSSGTFAQIDLRNCIRPLDAITTTTATWESSGSLTFATYTAAEWQIPYDDIPAERRALAEKQHIKVKALGDSCYVPVSQDLGTFNPELANDVEAFNRLARSYIFHGEDRPTICAVNARVAFQARREEPAQTWLLLGASLADLIPPTPAILSPTKVSSVQPTPHAVTSPTVTSNLYSFPTSASTPSQLRKASPNHAPLVTPRSASTSTSRKITPVSSNASSPRQIPVSLPPLPSTTPRRPSLFSGPRNVDSDFSRRPSVSMLRRPSISVPGSHSLSPADKTNLRHVGEGALDDSDSSSAEESDGELNQSSDEESGLQSLVSPGFLPVRSAPVPSPLSRVAGQHHWAEDEVEGRNRSEDGDDSSSPSPGSTDTDSSEPTIIRRRKTSKSASRLTRRHSSLMHSRSRSSTVASLVAPSTPSLSRKDSYSSIRTVLATETPVQEGGSGLRQEETIRDIRVVPQGRRGSELIVDRPSAVDNPESDEINPDDLTERHVKIVSDDEKRLRNLAWTALREALEKYADEVEVQLDVFVMEV
ncbi:hypothetical protein C0995_003532 [Termitomyces sp. Mi166|nr:hypothetical protein C0995_003532 [Termitomyces sp. Mi166\